MAQSLKLQLFILFVLLLGLTGFCFAQPAYSNLIIFGDSQSDIGNMPESSTVNSKIQARYYDHGMLYNLYIPATNPTIANNHAFASILHFAQLPIQPLINGQGRRQGRSINWSQYLFMALKANQQLSSTTLLPWASIAHSPIPSATNLSVDYAFAGALSGSSCADEGYLPAPAALCTETQVWQAQNDYRQHPDDNVLRGHVLIPGVQKQIEFFSQDLKAGKIHVDTNTLYIIWIGANDLGLNFINLLKGKDRLFLTNIKASIPGQTIAAIQQLQQLGAKNIIIIGQQNLGLTPDASLLTGTNAHFITRYLNAYALNFLVLQYNLHLTRQLAQLQQLFPQLQLHYVNLQSLFNRLSLLPHGPFYQHLGLACQNQGDAIYQAIRAGKLIGCQHYLYWNRAHMTAAGNQWVAQAILQQILPAAPAQNHSALILDHPV